jgi:methyltransferase (TIGR00027 family)
MNQTEPLVRNISDTALWVAIYRARESERRDALFHDPLARRLAGARGEQIAAAIPFSNKHTWSFVTRTWLIDRFLEEQIRDGVDMVINLAAGLDTRPYRMALPAAFPWIEVDLPDLLDYKEAILADEKPVCALERIRQDLSDVPGRKALFAALGRRAKKALILTEGLIIYFTAEEVGAFARDLATPPGFQRWILDLASPGLLRMLQRKLGATLSEAGSPLKFGPPEGPGFFTPHGWTPIDVRSMLRTAARLGRLPLWMRVMALLPESTGAQGSRPWSGICLLART